MADPSTPLDSTESALPPTPFAINQATTQQPIAGWFHDPTAWPTVLFFGLALIVIRIIAGLMTRRASPPNQPRKERQ